MSLYALVNTWRSYEARDAGQRAAAHFHAALTLGLAVAVVMISGWMRQLHTGPNMISAGDGGVLSEIQPGLEGGRDSGEQTDGQKGQEADRGAAAEDREAPAAAGRGEEAAR
jgi:hypothetical protein